MEELKSNIQKIKDLEVQGATNVAKFGLTSFNQYVKTLDITSRDEFLTKIEEANYLLRKIRPTEPCLRNGLQCVMNKAKKILTDQVDTLKYAIDKNIETFIRFLSKANEKIAKYGARRIVDNSTILTHCHSSAVVEILKMAYNDRKNIKVIVSETRPLFQGRKTAKELSDIGIETTMIVDSAMRWIVRHKPIDLILIGADSITVEGTVLNKIGSKLLALVAEENNIPFYVAATMLKYNPDSAFGDLEIIEMRNEKEIWNEPPSSLKILNPAFETISRDLISALITEIGVFPPVLISEKFEYYYPFLIETI
ncbi:MAG: translation initiation factor eIF-2B [Candidatus Hodarchaeota archaeon]